MLEGKELEKAIAQIMKRLRIVNITYIKKIAAQIRKIGELTPSSVNRLVAMSDMNADIGEIRELLRVAAAVNAKELRQVFTKAVTETKNDPRFARYLAKYPLKDAAKQRVERFVQSLYRQTAANMYNYSNTTAITQGYSEAIDKAVLASATGVSSYTETMRDTIREIGHAGLQVQYESGYHRRLDTAVRQNIVDAVNQINKNASIMIGEEINAQAGEDVYDAIEISAHARSAPDHEPVQGHVFMLEEYEKMQSGLMFRDIDGKVYEGFRRPIGEWNCRHTPMSFSTKWSHRKWTPEQLQGFIDENKAGCEIGGKHKTLYEAMQMMREIETAVRREKDTAVAAQAAGDDALRQECQRNINSLVRRYAQIAKASGNAEKRDRMTVEGFRAVKVPEKAEKGLTSGDGSDKIASEESPRKSKQGSFEVDWSKIQSAEYSAKFRKLSDNPTVSDALETRAKWALNNRSGKQTEELYAVSLTSGKEIARITDQQNQSGVVRTASFTARLNAADESGDKIMLLHNHPQGLPPSISDVNALLKNKNVSGITVGHNGTVYRYTRPEREVPLFDWRVELRNFKEFTASTSMEKALESLSKKYGFEFEIL